MSSYGLNDEQWAAVTAPSPTLVNASAGSGKTRCLVAKIQHLIDSGIAATKICAITFTNKAAAEMKERLKKTNDVSGMQISTIHSMCVRIIKTFPGHTPLKVPFSIYDDSDQLSVIKTIMKARGFPENPNDILSMISNAKSDDRANTLTGTLREIYKRYQAILLKNNAVDFDDLLLYARDCLKHEDCRSHFIQEWPHILVDETQDTSQIQYQIVLSLYDPQRTKTLFVVGDKNQCVVSGTAVTADGAPTIIDYVQPGSSIQGGIGRSSLSENIITRKNVREVSDLPVFEVITESGKSLVTSPNHMYFSDYMPPKKGQTRHFTYLMYKEGLGYRVGITKSKRTRGKGNVVRGYRQRLSQEIADAIWILRVSYTEQEARFYEHYYSVKYGLPTWVFYSKGRKGLKYTDSWIKRLYSEIDTRKGAHQLLSDLFMYEEYPHHIPRCIDHRRKRNFTIYLCGSERRTAYKKKVSRVTSHCFSLSGSDLSDAEALKELGLKVRPSKGKRGYRIEGVRASLEDIHTIVSKIQSVMDINVITKGRFSSVSLPLMPASHVRPGMTVFVEEEGKVVLDTVKEVRKLIYTGFLYDIDVGRVHNFVGNGILTHNSIYGWRGARPNNMQDFIKTYNPAVRNLTYNYRCSADVVAKANSFLQYGEPMIAKSQESGSVSLTRFPTREQAAERIGSAISKMGGNLEEIAILYRVNSRSLIFEQTFNRMRIPYKVVGDMPFYKRKVVKDLISGLKAASNPSDTESLARVINHPKRGFGPAKIEKLFLHGRSYAEDVSKDMPAIADFLKTLSDIKNMRPLDALNEYISRTNYFSVVTKDYEKILIDALRDSVAQYATVDELIMASTFLEEDYGRGVKLMTAHSAKGLEFDRVFVVGVEQGVWPHQYSDNMEEEERLFYVACTRARKYLNVSCCKTRQYRGQTMETFPSYLFKKMYKAVHGKDMRL